MKAKEKAFNQCKDKVKRQGLKNQWANAKSIYEHKLETHILDLVLEYA